MRPWAVYSRVSRVGDRADTLVSPELQVKRATDYAASRNLPVEVLAPELDVSGGTVERPILGAILDGIDSGQYAGVIVAQLDRLSRMDLADALRTIERVEAAGGQVIAVAENFDAATPEGRLGRNVFLAMSQMQLDRYKLQFRAAKARAVKHGIWPISKVPFGYRKRDDRRLEPDPETAPLVVTAYKARAAGEAWLAVGRILGAGRTGAKKVVTSRAYLGEINYGEWRNPAAHEPIVDADLWAAAQIHHPRPARRPGAQRALLAGLVRCAGCQAAMSPNTSQKGAYIESIYRCVPHKAAGKCAEPAIIAQGKLDAYVEALALSEIDRLGLTASQRANDLEDARRFLQAAEAELVAYQEAIRITDIGHHAFEAGMRSRAAAVDKAQATLAHARLAIAPVPDIGSLRDLWPQLDVGERAQVLRGTLGAVWVKKGKGPVEGRVRIVARGYEPARGDRGRIELAPLDWVGDLEGELRMPGTKHSS